MERKLPEVLERIPNAVLFDGQLVFPKTTLLSNVFHGYTLFAVQRRFSSQGISVVRPPNRGEDQSVPGVHQGLFSLTPHPPWYTIAA